MLARFVTSLGFRDADKNQKVEAQCCNDVPGQVFTVNYSSCMPGLACTTHPHTVGIHIYHSWALGTNMHASTRHSAPQGGHHLARPGRRGGAHAGHDARGLQEVHEGAQLAVARVLAVGHAVQDARARLPPPPARQPPPVCKGEPSPASNWCTVPSRRNAPCTRPLRPIIVSVVPATPLALMRLFSLGRGTAWAACQGISQHKQHHESNNSSSTCAHAPAGGLEPDDGGEAPGVMPQRARHVLEAHAPERHRVQARRAVVGG